VTQVAGYGLRHLLVLVLVRKISELAGRGADRCCS
jgi:hypothetical protein